MAGDWVLAGEPVGAMGAAPLYFELRRDGRPVDPQPWLASPGGQTGRSAETGEQRVRE
jgi:murein DD-endopeptidase MepM/ murein hydrolase activator NlpD